MQRQRLRGPLGQSPRASHASFVRAAAFYGGVTLLSSVICYGEISEKLKDEKAAIEIASSTNRLYDNGDIHRHAAAIRSFENGDDSAYRKTLAQGGDRLSDLEWVALFAAFHDNDVQFSAANVDTRDRYFLGKGIAGPTADDKGLASDIERWKKLRDEAMQQPGHDGKSEKRLMAHVNGELAITSRSERWQRDSETIMMKSALYGAFISTSMFIISTLVGFAALSLSLLSDRIKAMLARRREQKQAERPPKKPKPDAGYWSDDTPTQLEPFTGTYRRPIYDSAPNGVVDHLPDARRRLSEDFGPEFADAVFAVLKDKLSNTLAKRVAHGSYDELRKLVLSSRKAFELAGHEPEQLGGFFAARNSIIPESNVTPRVSYGRRRHELDDVERCGWKPNDFHRLLSQYGFDTSKVGGGGHCFVKYCGQKVRHSNGRFVIVPCRTSGSEITPGVASKVLKACADFLVLGWKGGPEADDS